jgi:hypothetical protein
LIDQGAFNARIDQPSESATILGGHPASARRMRDLLKLPRNQPRKRD